jgi:glycosyltransferase involved in cell wall biosynthesis
MDINYLYNLSDAVILLSSNEGWGLSLTEGMMCGKMIIANVTGGMQDQMRFEDEDGNWMNFDKDFCSNHFGKYKKCGDWAIPVFPSNISMQGSVPTPYIFDDRVDFRDAAHSIMQVYELGKEERERRGKLAHEWVTSEESMMSASNMCKGVINHVNEVIKVFKPKPKFELIKIDSLKRKYIRHKLIY